MKRQPDLSTRLAYALAWVRGRTGAASVRPRTHASA